ncbi:DUF3018 family protein [Dietzia aerolata]|uniref:Antitoxin MazE-like protein n=1 Tax=Dietzia aerolata TaxID=595984 RepID=A0ABV5JKQ8_9ACTN|nr:antitoxin MazE-like protein [Dietzia aerolata]MBB0968276.1 DUF3018 family protein [Dietzia aerolata]
MGSRDRARRRLERLRAHDRRPVRIRVADVSRPDFQREAWRQSATIAASADDAADQAFVDAVASGWDDG